MNANHSNEEDKGLNRLLNEWRLDASLPPRFKESVRRRIARAEAHPRHGVWQTLAGWVESTLSRPALATSYVAVLLFAGLATGYRQAQDKSAQAASQWRTAYVRSVDPYQAPRE